MRLRAPIMLAFLVAFVDQHSGINAILYYTPRILEMTGTTACGTAALRHFGMMIRTTVATPSARPDWKSAAKQSITELYSV